ncbi:MAG: cytochrome c3 family protein [Gemmatimonadota bacterium]
MPQSQDSAVAASALPDRVIPIIQMIFQQPPWLMWGGVIVAAIVLAAFLWWFWPRRQRFRQWIAGHSPSGKLAILAVPLTIGLAAAWLGARSYDFVQRDNRFCTGCHIFVPSGVHMTAPDTGNYTLVNKLEGKHDSLSCHACHELRPVKEAIKMVLWMSGDRGTGERVPPHARVPRKVCESCHVTGAAKKFWQAIASTAGHRTHLESDSLRGRIECLTCHAQSAHRFVPVDSTCSQRGCHLTSATRIRLGKMAGQTDFHCNVCHQFTKSVPLLATRDSAAGSLRPDRQECLSCHPMQLRMVAFDPSRDPHNGSCGTCHNPHAQVKPADALKSCTTSGCHDNWRKVPFHSGKAHARVNTRCELCHDPHAARVDASDCIGCHARVGVRGGGTTAVPPMPFDTLKALKRTSALPPPQLRHGKGDAPPELDFPAALLSRPQVADSFSHARHQKLACITCHSVTAKQTTLTFTAPRGCQICHHQAPATNQCSTCHAEADSFQFRQVALTVTVPGRPPMARSVTFSHASHAATGACISCHMGSVILAPPDSVATCTGCHVQHHTIARDCAACHTVPGLQQAHIPAQSTHIGCDACHTPATVALLTPARPLCQTCHADKVDHYAALECAACHLQDTPEGWRPHLMRQVAAR